MDTINGFVEVYLDARGVKGAWESLVYYVNHEKTDQIRTLARHAQWFEDHMPWDPRYRKPGVTGISANAIDVVVETGDSGPVTPIGINLPNDERIRAAHGSKSVSLTNVMEAYDRSMPEAYWAEFSWTREEAERAARWSGVAAELTTNMHEVIGHASGQPDARMAASAQAALREHYSTLEETRADLVALYFVPHPKLAELGLVEAEHQAEIACAAYEAFARNALVQLRRVREGSQLEEDHMRNRQLVVRWLMANTHAVQERWRDGKTFYVVVDVHAFHEGVGPAARRGPAHQEPGRRRRGPRAGRGLRRALRAGAARRDREPRAAHRPAVLHGLRHADARAGARRRRPNRQRPHQLSPRLHEADAGVLGEERGREAVAARPTLTLAPPRPPAGLAANRSTRRRDRRGLNGPAAAGLHTRPRPRRSRRKPLDTADKCVSRVLLAEALGPQPSAVLGPYDAFVEHS